MALKYHWNKLLYCSNRFFFIIFISLKGIVQVVKGDFGKNLLSEYLYLLISINLLSEKLPRKERKEM